MKQLILCAAIACYIACLVGCQFGPNPEVEKAKIADLLSSQIEALLKSDLNGSVVDIPDDLGTYVVLQGKIPRLSKDDFKKDFSSQFKKGKYTGAKNIVDPIITVSSDGNMAWVLMQTEFKYSYRDSLGNSRERLFVAALLAAMEKRGGKWVTMAQAGSSDSGK